MYVGWPAPRRLDAFQGFDLTFGEVVGILSLGGPAASDDVEEGAEHLDSQELAEWVLALSEWPRAEESAELRRSALWHRCT